jgi:hypothetical protein
VNPVPPLLICVASDGAEDLQVLKVYRHLVDETAESKGFFRVIDDSGEDYLYRQEWFLPLPLPPALERQLEVLAVEQSRA